MNALRILLAGTFYPHVGGIERSLELLAFGLVARGHEVSVVTRAPAPEPEGRRSFPFAVHWQPSSWELWRAHRWADVVLHFGMGFRLAWPALLVRTPQVVSHRSHYANNPGEKQWREYLKWSLTRFTRNVCVSAALARTIPGSSVVIRNCYDDAAFIADESVVRGNDLVFVGRLVSDKGVDLLLDALRQMAEWGAMPNLTVIGDGPDRQALERQARPFGNRVRFLGNQLRPEIAAVLQTHQVLVVPSRWHEPFGNVALEGIACGCFVVGSAGGGLPEAIGPCGLTFPNGDSGALAKALRRALTDEELRKQARAAAPGHLRNHTRATVVERYETLLHEVASRNRTDSKQRKRAGRRRAAAPPA